MFRFPLKLNITGDTEENPILEAILNHLNF